MAMLEFFAFPKLAIFPSEGKLENNGFMDLSFQNILLTAYFLVIEGMLQ